MDHSPEDEHISLGIRRLYHLVSSRVTTIVDEYSYVRHPPTYKHVRCGTQQLCEAFLSAYKPERKPLRRVHGSFLGQI
jgi:hypothetical protein